MYRKLMCMVVLVAVWAQVGAGASAAFDPNTDPNLVAWWALDGDAMDSSGNGLHGTVVGDPDWVEGKIGGAIDLDGSGDYVDCGNPPQLTIRDELTVMCWFKVASFTRTWETILGKGDNSYRLSRGGGTGNGTHMGISGTSASPDYFNAPTIVTDDKWHHIAGVYDGTQAIIYIDGKSDMVYPSTGQINESTYPLFIGENSQATGRFLDGLVDDVRVFNRALTAEEVKSMVPPQLKAFEPTPADGATGVMTPLLQWSSGETAVFHNVYLGTSPDLTEADLVGMRLPFTMHYHIAGFEPGATHYWRVDEVEPDGVTIYTGDLWTFTAAPTTAFAPNPRNGDKWIATDAVLQWQAGAGALSHDVYFGTDEAAVAARDASVFMGNQLVPGYEPAGMAEETTYYWAVDEIAMGGTKYDGELWSFTTTGPGGGVKAQYFMGTTPEGIPLLEQIEPAIDHTWGDGPDLGTNSPATNVPVDGFSARWTADLEIAIPDTYTFITTSDDGVRLWLDGELIIDNWTDHGTTDNTSDPLDLAPGVYLLVMEYYENTGGAVAQLSWESPTMERGIIPAGPLQPPLRAQLVNPPNGAVDVPQDITLQWSAGDLAASHHVYFGDDRDAVANATPASAGIYRGSQPLENTSYTPGPLEWGKTYYWRIDEDNPAEADAPWQGGVWSFTTADFLVVEDFESYDDDIDGGTAVFLTWIDGFENVTGSTVGYLVAANGTFNETGNVHGGRQAMPYDYNNIVSPFYSEAERTWMTPQNWTAQDVDVLTIWFHGAPPRFVQNGPDSFTMSASGTDIWDVADEFRYVYKRLNGDGSIVARVDSLVNTNGWAKAGVMIREGLNAGDKHASVVVTPSSGVSFQRRPFSNDVSEHTTQAGITAPHWVRITRTDNTFKAEHSPDGAAWTSVGTDVAASSDDVPMMSSVYIGLCLTSHDAALTTTAEFSEVTAAGGVSGQWQVAEIGAAHTANDLERMYVKLEDSAGRSATVPHPDPEAVFINEWTPWYIPLADFAPVNAAAVKKMTIGFGDDLAPQPNGHGLVLFDDIRVIKGIPAEPEPQE